MESINNQNFRAKAEKVKELQPVLNYFFELQQRGAVRFDGKKGKEYFFGYHHQRTGSIAVSDNKNLWFDHAEGVGGDVIAAVQQFEGKTYVESIERLLNLPTVARPVKEERDNQRNGTKLEIVKELDRIAHPALVQYINSRGLEPNHLLYMAKEIHWEKEDKHFFGIGFKNDRGGYAVRSALFKLNMGPGGISNILVGAKPTDIKIFEGGFDLASFKRLYPKASYHAVLLNSVVHLTEDLMNKISLRAARLNMQVGLYLDNDHAGNTKTSIALSQIEDAYDGRTLYKESKDLNDCLLSGQCRGIGR